MKLNIKIIIVLILALMCLIMTYYFHYVDETQIVFTHVFYVPIVIASIYWKRAGIFIAIFLGIYLIISQMISSLVSTPFDLIRSVMFVVIALVITIITNKNKEIKIQLKQNEESVKLNKKLKEANELLTTKNIQIEDREFHLRETIATRDKLFSIIAHDLRSPFNSILGFSELLIEDIKDFDIAKSEEHLGIIKSSAINTLILLDNLLNWAKSQTGQINFKPQKIILSSIIREIIETSNSTAKIKNISLNFIQLDEIEVYANENMVKTILRNLISNAIKFTKPDGNVNILVISEQNQVEISISDTGVGMNEKTSKKLFNTSTNLISSGTANEKGSGLGLVICKEFVEKLGGNIWVESEEGKGSDFKFTLPLIKS